MPFRFLTIVVLTALLSLPLPAQSETEVVQPTSGPTDPAELEAFLDGVMAAHLAAHDVAGATLSIVKDGEVLLAKGYGYADVEAKRKVDPQRTLFRIGSVAKLFTWTAVMQLAEQRKLDLDADLNGYLKDFQIPATYPEPVTLAHLMTHTPGFEDHVIGLFARSADRLRPLAEILTEEMPARVRPPGRLSSYSNHGTGMAGYVVEQVSGLSFDDYVETNILRPLGMEHTTFRQPVPVHLAADLSRGYSWGDGRFQAQEFEMIPLAPAGSASSSAADMARFMIAHLQGGAYGPDRILQPETAHRMHSLLFAHEPGVPGWLHGFYEMNRNGQRIFGHGGDTMDFHTQLMLLPEHGLGLFVSYNSRKGTAARSQLLDAFLDRYFPVEEADVTEPAADFETQAGRVAGTYRVLRYSHSTLAKLGALASELNVDSRDGLLVTQGQGEPTRWRLVEPLVFREVDGPNLLVFRANNQGEVTHLFPSAFPIALERIPAWENSTVQLAVLGACAALFLTALLAWPFGAWSRWRRGKEGSPPPARAATIFGWATSALFLLFLAGLAYSLREPSEIAYAVPRMLEVSLVLPLVAAALLAVSLLWAAVSWKKRYWGLAKRLHFSVVVLAGVVFLLWLHHWNLLGFYY